MGKRSNYKRRARDRYDTPESAVKPLIAHLHYEKSAFIQFMEPFAGCGALIKHLRAQEIYCKNASDISPRADGIKKRNALKLNGRHFQGVKLIITNTPWDRKILHAFLDLVIKYKIAKVWLLLDADYAHTIQAIPYMGHCRAMVAVGRVKWIKKSKFTGKDNCCWYLFTPAQSTFPPFFYPRVKS